ESTLQLRLQLPIELLLLPNRGQQTFFARLQVILEFSLKFLYPFDRHKIDIAILHRPHHGDLFLDRDRIVLFLLKKLDNPLAAIKSRSRRRIQIGAKLREGSELPKLREIELYLTSHLLDGFDLSGGTDPADRKPNRDRRPHPLVKK